MAALGFWPGLCSLMPLDPRHRLNAPKYNPPRTWTPKGTIGHGGAITCIYPDQTPGGYQIFARTPMPIWDREQRLAAFKDSLALFKAGDRVRFVPIDRAEWDEIDAKVSEGTYRHPNVDYQKFSISRYRAWLAEIAPASGEKARLFEVMTPGLETSVQDLPGRIGYWEQGFPPSGPVDMWSFRLANLLVGNDRDAAALECQFLGPTLKFLRDGHVAVTGADMAPTLDGAEVPRWRTIAVRQGQVLALSGARTGARSYIAFAGGIDTPPVLGSRSTFHMAGVGGVNGYALKAGQRIPVAAVRRATHSGGDARIAAQTSQRRVHGTSKWSPARTMLAR